MTFNESPNAYWDKGLDHREAGKDLGTLESGIDVGQEITVGPGKFIKKNKRRALNKRRA